MTGPGPIILSVLMIAAFLLAAGGMYMIVRRKERGKGALMLLAAFVAVGDVLIWTL
jgi:LPXTG-motif cell wall-anchored protein